NAASLLPVAGLALPRQPYAHGRAPGADLLSRPRYSAQPGVHRLLHSFPTRRSSDLGAVDPVSAPPGVVSASVVDDDTGPGVAERSEEHTSELQSQSNLVCRLLLEKKKKTKKKK